MPRSLDLSRLQQFGTSQQAQGQGPGQGSQPAPEPRPEPERWPSREPVRDGQVSIKAPLDVIARFKKLCKDDRRTYADMLTILMNAYEQREPR